MPSNEKLIKIILRLQDEVSGNVGKATDSLQKMSSTLTSVGSQMTAAFTVPLVAVGAAGVNMAMELDKSMRNIQSISKQTDEEIKALSQTFVDMSRDASITTDSANGLAEAFYQIQSSGFAGDDAMQVLIASTKAATAGLTTTEVAAEATVAVLNAYGLSAEHAAEINDIMFETVNRGVVSYEQLSGAIGTVVGLAAQMGVTFEEIGAAMATMTKQGIDADTAMTNLNGIFTALLRPTTEMQKAIEELGYASGSAMIDALGLGGTMAALEKHTGGSQEAMAALFGDVRALRGAMALTGAGASMFAEDLAMIGDASGAAAEAFAIQMQSFDAKWKSFQNTLGAAAIEIGNLLLPVLSSLLDTLKPIVDWFIGLDDATQGWIVGILAVVAAIGPLLVILGTLAGAALQLQAFFIAFPAVAAIITGPIGWIIAGLTALFIAYHTNFLGIRDIMNGFVQFMSEAWAILTGQFVETENPILLWLKDLVYNVQNAWAILQNPLGALMQALELLITGDFTGGVFEEDTWFTSWLLNIRNAILNFIPTIMDLGGAIINGLLNGIKSKAVELVAYIFNLSKDMENAIRSALGISSPSKVMMGLGENVVQGFQKGMDNLGGLDVGVTANGRPVSSASPSLAAAGGGGSVTYNNYFTLPPGSDRQTVDRISKELGKQAQRKGAQKYR